MPIPATRTDPQRASSRRPRAIDFLKLSTWRNPLKAVRCLWFDYGHLRSAATGRCTDASGTPVPWYTYPAIEYVRQLDFTNARVFEYGSGGSTLFWSANALHVVSVEDDEVWHAQLAADVPGNCELILETDLARYPDVIHRFPDPFDVIIVDGPARARTRMKCARAALEHLRPGGIVILDNSDWLPESSRLLRESGLIQVDMAGLAPLIDHTQTTSFFLHREFAPRPKGARLPLPGPGAIEKNWEHFAPVAEPSVMFGGEAFGDVQQDTPVSFTTPDGVRRFRVLSGQRWAALLDVDAERVLLWVTKPADLRVLANAAQMQWDDFIAYVRRHPLRRYVP